MYEIAGNLVEESDIIHVVYRTPSVCVCYPEHLRYATHFYTVRCKESKTILDTCMYPSHIHLATSFVHPLLFLPALPVVPSPPTSLTTPIPSTATLLSCTVPPSFRIICSLAFAAPGESQPSS